MSMTDGIRKRLGAFLRRRGGQNAPEHPRATLTAPEGALDPAQGKATCVIVVGPSFNQAVPTAMMTFRQGYADAFESLEIPYLFLDQHDLCDVLPGLPNPFCMVNGSDFVYMDQPALRMLRRHSHCVWVDPWFGDSDRFFASHGLNAAIWHWSPEHRKRILDSGPAFVHTATVPGGLGFFAEWERHGMKVVSLPLACDLSLYARDEAEEPTFQGVKLAFVGGYWESKGKQLDDYLRPYEDDLAIYGYSPWPYRGYRGMLDRAAEPVLYRQALLSPVINEPSVAILKGQINERIFKVLGAGGVPLVDAVPAYRELFSPDELLIPADVGEFHELVRKHLSGDDTLVRLGRKGREAVLSRHTYRHRAEQLLAALGLQGEMTCSKENPHGTA
ncbi:MAG: hypothetical protein A2075_15600 [Geobacteraceae bacterium GWC2_58_44]|nr:MAG: hypothetical protein A2075_15600 [Geobacteraceae bacterium GWC2_58_44]HBG06009.1 hypothetical protein [Geobacter sp.]